MEVSRDSKKINVCIVTTSFPRWQGDFSGAMVWNLTRWLQRLGCRVKVVTQHYEACSTYDNMNEIEVFRFRYAWPARLECIGTTSGVIDDLRRSWLARLLSPFFLISFIRKVWQVSKGCQIIHVQWVPGILVALPTKYLRKLPIIVNSRTNPDTVSWKSIYKLLLPRADYVVYNSVNTFRITERTINHPHTSVIGSGINIQQFLRPSANHKQTANSEILRLIVVARLVEFKGIEYLIRALPTVQNAVNARLDIHGDGPMRLQLKKLVKELGLENAIFFHGETPHKQIPSELWKSDIFLLPSIVDSFGRTEGFGAVILEAMASGLPVIASRVGGIPDIINESNGILVEPKDVTAIANAIIFLAKNPKARHKLGLAARDWVVTHFSEDAICEQYKLIYNSVLKDSIQSKSFLSEEETPLHGL